MNMQHQNCLCRIRPWLVAIVVVIAAGSIFVAAAVTVGFRAVEHRIKDSERLAAFRQYFREVRAADELEPIPAPRFDMLSITNVRSDELAWERVKNKR